MKEKKAALKEKNAAIAVGVELASVHCGRDGQMDQFDQLKEKNAAIAVGIELASVHCGRDGQMDQFDQPNSPQTTKLSRPQAPESKYRMIVPSVKQE